MRFVFMTMVIFLMPFLVYAQEQCVMEKCHGLEMSCAVVKGPQACPAIYELGDFCRQYAKCEMKDGQCQLIKEQKFDICVACVDACREKAKEENPFDCELQCRTQMEKEGSSADKPEAPFASCEDLAQAVKDVLKAKEASRLPKLYCWWGVDADMKKQTLSALENLLNKEINGVDLVDLPADFPLEHTVNGTRYRPSVTPVGLVSVDYLDQATKDKAAMTIPYGEVDGGYCLVSTVREIMAENN